MAFRWRADDGSLIVVFGPSHPHQLKKNVVKVGPPLTKFSGSAHDVYQTALMLTYTTDGSLVTYAMPLRGRRYFRLEHNVLCIAMSEIDTLCASDRLVLLLGTLLESCNRRIYRVGVDRHNEHIIFRQNP